MFGRIMSANYLVNIINSSSSHKTPQNAMKRQTIVRNFSIHWVEIVFVQRFFSWVAPLPLLLPLPLSLSLSLYICMYVIFKTLRWRAVPRSTYLALVRWAAPCAPHALEKHEAARKTSPATQQKISSRLSCSVFSSCSFCSLFSVSYAFAFVLVLVAGSAQSCWGCWCCCCCLSQVSKAI